MDWYRTRISSFEIMGGSTCYVHTTLQPHEKLDQKVSVFAYDIMKNQKVTRC